MKHFALITFLFPFSLLAAAPSSQSFRVDFTVHTPNSKSASYKGFEDIEIKDGFLIKNSSYFDLKGRLVLEEKVKFLNKSLKLQSYSYKNKVSGVETKALLVNGDKLKVNHREVDKPPQEGEIQWTERSIHGKSFHELILKNWNSLKKGTPLKFDLVLPIRFTSVSFALTLEKKETREGIPFYIYNLAPDSFFIRQFVPEMSFTYKENKNPRIVSFKGPTALPINGETGKTVVVKFSY